MRKPLGGLFVWGSAQKTPPQAGQAGILGVSASHCGPVPRAQTHCEGHKERRGTLLRPAGQGASLCMQVFLIQICLLSPTPLPHQTHCCWPWRLSLAGWAQGLHPGDPFRAKLHSDQSAFQEDAPKTVFSGADVTWQESSFHQKAGAFGFVEWDVRIDRYRLHPVGTF